MVKKFKGDCAKNARIKIDYQGVKPKVTFSYPDKKHQYSGSMFTYILGPTLLLSVIFYYIFFAGYASATTLDIVYDKSELQKFAECAALNPNQTLTNYSNIKNNVCESDKLIIPVQKVFFSKKSPFLWLFIIPFGLTSLIYYPFKKKWMNVYPKFQAWKAKKKQIIFKSGDVQHNEDYYCEVPLFENIILDYTATEDFSKYLKFFEIREHDFRYYKKPKRRKKPKTKIDKFFRKGAEIERKKAKLNEWLWYAKFYFSEKPIKGKLEVIFK